MVSSPDSKQAAANAQAVRRAPNGTSRSPQRTSSSPVATRYNTSAASAKPSSAKGEYRRSQVAAADKRATVTRTARRSLTRSTPRTRYRTTMASIAAASTAYGSGANMEKLTNRATGMRWTSSTMSAHANPTTAQPIPGVRAKRERIEPIRPLPPCLRLYQKTRMRCLPACNFIPFVGGKTRPRLVASNKLGCRPRAAHPSHAAQSPHPSAHEHQGKEREQWN